MKILSGGWLNRKKEGNMKKAKDLTIGAVVDVPDYCFAPTRYGWNGWIFRAGIIRQIGKTKKSGRTMYQVERCVLGYGQTKKTFTKWFYPEELFEFSYKHSQMLMEHPREYWQHGTYDDNTEFLIDQGIIKYPY